MLADNVSMLLLAYNLSFFSYFLSNIMNIHVKTGNKLRTSIYEAFYFVMVSMKIIYFLYKDKWLFNSESKEEAWSNSLYLFQVSLPLANWRNTDLQKIQRNTSKQTFPKVNFSGNRKKSLISQANMGCGWLCTIVISAPTPARLFLHY